MNFDAFASVTVWKSINDTFGIELSPDGKSVVSAPLQGSEHLAFIQYPGLT